MKNNDELREKAMQILAAKEIDDISQWGTNVKMLIEELSIYQIELEHQNEELVQSQLDLEAAKESFSDTFENAPIGYIILDKDRVIINANTTFCNMVRLNKDDIQGNNIEKYIGPLYQDVFHHFFRTSQKTGMLTNTELKIRSANLSELYVKIDAISTKSGHIRMSITDISLLKRLEHQLRSETEKLQKSETKFRQIIERTSEVFFYQDVATRRFEYVSPKVQELLGFTENEVMRMDNDDIVTLLLPKFRFGYLNLIDDLVALSGTSIDRQFVREFKMYTKEKEIKWIKASYTLIRDSKDNPSRVMGCLTDITSAKQYESDLIEAKNKAEESDRLKSTFLANISHEIRTPMNGIIGFSKVLKDKIDPSDANFEFVEIIEKSSNNLLELINNLIAISKIESHQLQIKKATFDFNMIMEECYALFSPEAKERNLDFRVVKSENPIDITTDKEKITSVIYNLVKNALKFTNEGFVEMGAELRNKELYFYVKDSGIGIAKEKYNLLFKRFTQVDETNFNEGVGLGLCISKGVLDLLEGTIGFESELHKGSTFWFTLPYDKSEIVFEKLTPTNNIEMNLDLNGKYIIIAEDDYASALLLQKYLADTNAKMTVVGNGNDLMELLEHETPDFVLLDINMPKKNGLQCLDEILKKKIKTKVIVETAYAQEEDLAKYLKLGASSYISKPTEKEQLLLCIKELL